MIGFMQGRERMDRQLLDAQALVGHLVPAGSMFAFLAGHRGELFTDEDFADLFPSGAGPAVGPGQCDGLGPGVAGAARLLRRGSGGGGAV
jgi:hypothetical protein